MSLAAAYRPLALSVAARFNGPDRAGIVSAALWGLVEAERDFDPDRGSFGPLAATAARRECISEVLRQRRATARERRLFIVRPDGEEEERPDLPRVAPADAGAPLMIARLWEVLAELRPHEREVLVRRYGLEGEEQTYEEIAIALGVCRSTVRSVEARALAKLRAKLRRRTQEVRHALRSS